MTFQILQSLTLLAEHNVIHCDLKPEVRKKKVVSLVKEQKKLTIP